MSYINTLEAYDRLIKSGVNDIEARAQVFNLIQCENAVECHAVDHKRVVLEWLKEAKADFASQKFISIIGGLIVIVGCAIVGQMWNLSVKFERMDADFKYMWQEIKEIKNNKSNSCEEFKKINLTSKEKSWLEVVLEENSRRKKSTN
jgi:hypothetical protein